MGLRNRSGVYEQHGDGDRAQLLPPHKSNARVKGTWRQFAWLAASLFILVAVALYWSRSRHVATESYYVVHNAVVHTVDLDRPPAEAFVVRNGHFVAVGDKKILFEAHPLAEKLDLDGKTVVPGLIDSHGHLIEQGLAFLQADVGGSQNLAEVRGSLVRYLDARPDIEKEHGWVIGKGWDQSKWAETNYGFPNATDLDRHPRLSKVPICLYRNDYHAYWLNTRALDIVASHIPPPDQKMEGGEVVRDASGRLMGIFLDRAMEMIDLALPQPTETMLKDALHAVTSRMLQHGLTGLHDAGVSAWQMGILRKAVDEGRMPIRNYAMVRCQDPEKYCGDTFTKGDYGGRLTVGSVKLFLDGAVGSWGAALIDPYSDDVSKSGFVRIPTERINDLITEWAQNGFQVNIHSIGDLANKLALDGFETCFRRLGLNGTAAYNRRMRIEHAQIIVFKGLRAICKHVFKSQQATSDMAYVEKRLGHQRIRGAYAWRSLKNAGVQHLALGSDFPIEGVNPLLGIHAAVTRLDESGASPHGPGGWYPSERLTPEEALRGFTLDAAWAAFQEHELGSITAGKKADFAVFDRNFLAEPQDILKANCVATVVDGVVAYGHL
ncbi:hypothetical protein PhCBS80983_g00969 [Powellomyces hirtus]|uniref:Amidohydrolase 3 domain-containing protein n=1 Tax=Powellomyces hirtus TaxID=109895 RepID=A0A507EE52_9FUNG|nr:hypothetical protein PhCBS80983_g00969 [Powellomyces hirtus]